MEGDPAPAAKGIGWPRAAAARRAAPRPPARRPVGIRWDRVGRIALGGTLLVILCLYVSPAKHWLAAVAHRGRAEAGADDPDRREPGAQEAGADLRDPGALEREARRLGMVRQGERAYVIEGLSGG